MVGFSGDQWFDFVYGPFIWTKQLGTANLDDFVKLMGGDLLGLPTLWTPNAISPPTAAPWVAGPTQTSATRAGYVQAQECLRLPRNWRQVPDAER